MSKKITLYELPPSPNNQKVRIALGYKGLGYERELVDMTTPFPFDRSKVVAVSTQPRTPVLKHGDTVIFDSGAILRYLDANFPDTPRLFSEDYATMGEIEDWELYARTAIGKPIRKLFGQALAPKADRRVVAEAGDEIHRATARIEGRLAESPFLVGDRLSAADVTCAAGLALATIPASAEVGPVGAFFREHLTLGTGRERTAAWIRRVLAYDK